MINKNKLLNIIEKKIIKKFINNSSFFFLTYSCKGILKKTNNVYNDNFFDFFVKNLNPKIKKYEHKNRILIICGNPIINEKLNASSEIFFNDIIEKKNYTKINGSFILFIYDKKKNELLIINDRFVSRKLFYTYIDNIFFASSSFKLIYELRKEFSTIKYNQDSILEFIYFRQIFGNDTLEKNCKFLESASTFLLKKDNTTQINKYWEPKYYEINLSRSEFVDLLSQKIERSIKLHTSDKKEFGLLLSGGLDSRCILGVCKKKLSCFTIAPKKNNEFYIANSLAKSTNNNHFFLLNPNNPLNSKEKLNEAIFHLGGSHNYSGFELNNFKKILNKNAETILMGLNFDLFFKALYLPKKNITFFGKNFLYKKLNNLKADIVNQFIDEIGFKLKSSNPFLIFKNEKEIIKFKDKVYYKINKIKEKGDSLNAKGYNLWEYFYYQNLSRNIIFSMMDSLSTFTDVRLPSLENDLFDLAINMPAKYKMNGNIYKEVLNKLCPNLMEFDYANTNIKAKHSLKKQNLIKIYNYFLNKIFNYKKYKPSPGWHDRSWNPPEYVLSNSKVILKEIKNLENSNILKSIDAIDINKVSRIIKEQGRNEKNNADLLNLLLTINNSLI